jgi:predicted ATPase/class 3 adenylate cyclase/Tfp pilus assembly protein PilF
MPALPSGTVTFLFTDIPGSTRLWEEYPDAMRLALARHDDLLREAIERHNGHIFKVLGDAFCVAFHTAPEALNTVLDAQKALISEPWPAAVTLKVRMALHAGPTELRDNDYFGQPVNRVARLLDVAHEGQVLISAVARELVRDGLPSGCSLLNLGEHRLRDLNHPETVYQLLHSDLPADFPAPKSLNNLEVGNNLPLQATSFIGREKAIAEISALLAKSRMLTLTGAGGSGKTRLALQIAVEVLERYPDGVWLAELAPLGEPDLVPQIVAHAVAISEQPGKNLQQTLLESMKSKKLLLLLDNCEHLIAACAQLTAALLRTCPNITVLATSRKALNIVGEQTYTVPSLTLPDAGLTISGESLSRYEAVRLFIERAQLVKPDFAVTDTDTAALAQVCRRLDGIPLAIELAAARVRALTVEDINTRLDNCFRLLTGGSRTAVPRQQTLRALIDWSYDLLSEQEKMLLNRLSVFSGGWTLAAAEQVSSGESIEDWEVLDLLTGLVDKSLVIADTQGATTRYRLLETVRQYARERLVESGESVESGTRHRDYFLALAEAISPKLGGSEQASWLAVLEEEHDNLRLVLNFCLEDPDGAEAGLRLAGALQRFWLTRGHLSEGRQHLAAALSRPVGPERLHARAAALNGSGVLALRQSDYATARAHHQESLDIYREQGDKRGIAHSLNNLGNVAHDQGDYARARMMHQESLEIRRELGDKQGIAASLGNQGNVALRQGDYTAARIMYEECLATFRELGNRWGVAAALNSLGNVAHDQGDYSTACILHRESLTIERELGDKPGIANSLNNLGNATLLLSDYNEACVLHQESLAIRRELGDRWGIAGSLENLGIAAYRQGDFAAAHILYRESLAIRRELGDMRGIAEALDSHAALAYQEHRTTHAVQLWGALMSLREAIGLYKPQNEREEYEQQLAHARAALGEDAFAAAWDEGNAMPWEQAVALALGE